MLFPSAPLRAVTAVNLLPPIMSLTEAGAGMGAAGAMSGSCGLSTGA